MNIEEKKELLNAVDEEMLLADGFEDALIGFVQIFNNTVALYHRQTCKKILMERDGMTDLDAEEYLHFNVTGSYVGEKTPAFAFLFTDEEI
jgi:hypothetical protein